jgi:hypothetical protein
LQKDVGSGPTVDPPTLLNAARDLELASPVPSTPPAGVSHSIGVVEVAVDERHHPRRGVFDLLDGEHHPAVQGGVLGPVRRQEAGVLLGRLRQSQALKLWEHAPAPVNHVQHGRVVVARTPTAFAKEHVDEGETIFGLGLHRHRQKHQHKRK